MGKLRYYFHFGFLLDGISILFTALFCSHYVQFFLPILYLYVSYSQWKPKLGNFQGQALQMGRDSQVVKRIHTPTMRQSRSKKTIHTYIWSLVEGCIVFVIYQMALLYSTSTSRNTLYLHMSCIN